jgi:DNA replication and repair protein RecF
LALLSVKITDFRCIESASLSFGPANNLISGPNASGKTSILEAIAYLGRARSFRGAGTRELIRHGAEEFVIVGMVQTGNRSVNLGIRNSKEGLEVRAGGEKSGSAAPLAEALPLQVIDPDVHELIAGGPESRRRYIDWIAFHVEQGYLETWRRYRRTLRQRNAALKEGTAATALSAWDAELDELGTAVSDARERMVEIVAPAIAEYGEKLLASRVDVSYSRGWPADTSLLQALRGSARRDQQLGSTQQGPHRADLRLSHDERQARKLVSRGQQKLLACAMILAATEIVQTALEKPLLLLLDDPSAELDTGSVTRLMAAVEGLGSQVIATTLDPQQSLFRDPPGLFHVEQGCVETAAESAE